MRYQYFSRPGAKNTSEVLEMILSGVEEKGIKDVIIPSCSGRTALEAAQLLKEKANLVCVTHVTGFSEPNVQEMPPETRQKLEQMGLKVLTCQHAFGGVGRAVRKKLGTYQIDEIIAYTLRTFGQGVKVAIEIALMAADAGLVRTDRDCISAGGTATGIDTALILTPANSADFFDLKVREIICKPAQF
ncbi:MAG TPA: pyruvate kinase alpha/beta domain-containing protein [Syntrophales bacterium]|nr:pyruvate kinase alpha/beta domain-containing protein [Syntrophales bacterium]HOL59165.1 pyruvate kinase alpha/beta domain-containing protein [Syntrophales bacterium]HPO35754.1 pyruvate kinase alpha/beta domain-containing protein [Syntrophales bacterium]